MLAYLASQDKQGVFAFIAGLPRLAFCYAYLVFSI
jgi:hypothetical protein